MLTGRQQRAPGQASQAGVEIPTYKGQDRALRAGRVGPFALLVSTAAGSAPMAVVAGTIPVAYSVTGIVGFPLIFAGLGVVLALFAVGYAELSRHVHNSGAFYALIARGLGGTVGTGAAFTALLSYSAIQTAIYPGFGTLISVIVHEVSGVTLQWWVPALLFMGVIAIMGALKIDINARVLGLVLLVECVCILFYIAFFVSNPGSDGISFEAWRPSALYGPGLGAAVCYALIAYAGVESGPVYAEEVRRPHISVGRATYWGIILTTVLYAFGAWAMGVAAGPDWIIDSARSHEEEGDLLVVLLGDASFSAALYGLTAILFGTSMFAALLSFHNVIARYCFAMGRDRLLPRRLGFTSRSTGAPALGSLTQTLISFVVVVVLVLTEQNSRNDAFTWISYVGALGILLLMALTSLSVCVFFLRRRVTFALPLVSRLAAAALATLALTGAFVLSLVEFEVLTGVGPDSPLRWVLPGLVIGAAVLGMVYGWVLRVWRPTVYARIGLGNQAFQLEKAAAGAADDEPRPAPSTKESTRD